MLAQRVPGNPARLVGLLGGVVENDGGEQHVVWIEARDLQCADAAAMCAGFFIQQADMRYVISRR